MKKIIVILSLSAILVCLFTYNKKLIAEKNNLIREFNNSNILDIDGNANLTEIKTKRQKIVTEVTTMLKEENATIETFSSKQTKCQ